jgi:hypothetical protein
MYDTSMSLQVIVVFLCSSFERAGREVAIYDFASRATLDVQIG